MTQGFDLTAIRHADFKRGAASRQAEIDKIKSDNQLFESQVGQACVKWKEIAEKRQAEIDELRSELKAINEYQELIFNELQFVNTNYELVFNKLEDIDDLSKGESNE